MYINSGASAGLDSSLSIMSTIQDHIRSANLRPPAPSQDVYKDDCAYCFDTPVSMN